MTSVAPTLQAFFTDRLARQRQVSPRTVASYRDTLRLLVCFVQDKTGKAPSVLDWDDLRASPDPHASALDFARAAVRHACAVCEWDPALSASLEGDPPPVV